MGMFSDLLQAEYCGKKIEVECRLVGRKYVYCLVIDNERVDKIEGGAGYFTLRGKIENNGEENNIIVRITQPLLLGMTKYKLEINGDETPLEKIN